MDHLPDIRWLLVPGGLLLLYWLLQPARPLYYHGQHQSDLPLFMQSAFMLLRPGAVVHIQHEGSARRLRLRKITLPGDHDGVRLDLPRGVSGDEHESMVRAALLAAGFHVGVAPTVDRLWPSRDLAHLVVDGLSAIDAFRAFEVARRAMGLDQEARFTMHIERTPSLSAGRKYRAARS